MNTAPSEFQDATSSDNLGLVPGEIGGKLPGVSIVTCAMNRTDNLLRVLRTWLPHEQVREIIIVDWSSGCPIATSLVEHGISDPQIRVIRADAEPRWILTYAFNLGFRFARYDKIIKIDADITLSDSFFDKCDLGTDEFLAGSWEAAKPGQQYINGFLYVRSEHLACVMGYNEYLTTYGWDDDDIYSRLASIGLRRSLVDLSTIHHLDHDDAARIDSSPRQEYILDQLRILPIFNIRKNRFIALMAPRWNGERHLAPFEIVAKAGPVTTVRRIKDRTHNRISDDIVAAAEFHAATEILSWRIGPRAYHLSRYELVDLLKKNGGKLPRKSIVTMAMNRAEDLLRTLSDIRKPIPGKIGGKLPGTSIVTCVMDRTEDLVRSLRTWLLHEEVKEVVIVDWCSETRIAEALIQHEIKDTRIRVVRVETESRWIPTYAFNLGFRYARYDKLMKLDAGIALSETFFDSRDLAADEFLIGSREAAKPGHGCVNGLFYIWSEHMAHVKGYNEYVTSGGWIDDDLYCRLVAFGLRCSPVDPSTIDHSVHDDAAQFTSGSGEANGWDELRTSPIFITCRNRFIAFVAPRWNGERHFALIRKRHFAPFELIAQAGPLTTVRREKYKMQNRINADIVADAEFHAATELLSWRVGLQAYQLSRDSLDGLLSETHSILSRRIWSRRSWRNKRPPGKP